MPYGEIPRGVEDMRVYFYVQRWIVQDHITRARAGNTWFAFRYDRWVDIKRVKGQGWVYIDAWEDNIREGRKFWKELTSARSLSQT